MESTTSVHWILNDLVSYDLNVTVDLDLVRDLPMSYITYKIGKSIYFYWGE